MSDDGWHMGWRFTKGFVEFVHVRTSFIDSASDRLLLRLYEAVQATIRLRLFACYMSLIVAFVAGIGNGRNLMLSRAANRRMTSAFDDWRSRFPKHHPSYTSLAYIVIWFLGHLSLSKQRAIV